jgi:hypothetical protein
MGKKKRNPEPDANRDPLSNEPGAHPVGVGVGATGGATTGAAMGAIGGPMGVAVGAAVGGLVGGLAGKTAAEALNPSVEDDYWRRNYKTRPYVKVGVPYEVYRLAYQQGWEARGRYGELNWERVEPRLREEWTQKREAPLSWEEASSAARDAFSRLRPTESYRAENR